MSELELFYLAVGVWALLAGINKFVPNEVLATVAAVAAIVTGILALILVF